ncbi:MAG: DUF4838 domain-containing protein [Candidatus Omnitrophica bacterium]|nr:DUF4838 domain-containing protein [Candidatus Omnitrophota bacterium]
MKIFFHNLGEMAHKTILEDIAAVKKAAGRHSINLPEIGVKIVSVSNPGIPFDIPSHCLTKSSNISVSSFSDFCRREKEKQSFQIIKDERYFWVIGGDEIGAIYGFDELLRATTGVIWAGPRDEDIIFGKSFEIDDGLNMPYIPLRARYASWYDMSKYLRWMRRNRWNMWVRSWAYFMNQSEQDRKESLKLADNNFLLVSLTEHSMHYFLQEDEFEKRPQWFGMRNGKRLKTDFVVIPDCPHLHAKLPVQPCYSNTELVEYLTDKMAQCIRKFPLVNIWGIWPHDGVNNWCMCENCIKKTPYEHMYNIAMRLLEKVPSHIFIELLSYSNLLNVPWKELPFSKRTFTLFCTYLRQYKQRIYDDGFSSLELGTRYPLPDRINPVDDREYGILFEKWLKVWKKCGSVPGIFEYGPQHYDETRRCDAARYLYHPNPEIRNDEIKWYAKKGVEVFYLCSIYSSWPDGFHQWVLADGLWNPVNNIRDLEKHFYTALAKKNGLVLSKFLKKLHHKLLYENKSIDKELKELQNLLKKIDDKEIVKKYEIWIEFVRLVHKSRQAELSGNFEQGITLEKEIQKLCQENEEFLENFVSLNNVIKTSQIAEQRFKEWKQGKMSTSYTM